MSNARKGHKTEGEGEKESEGEIIRPLPVQMSLAMQEEESAVGAEDISTRAILADHRRLNLGRVVYLEWRYLKLMLRSDVSLRLNYTNKQKTRSISS